MNIKNISKMLMVLLSVVFLLTACDDQTKTTSEVSIVPAGQNTQTMAESHNECWVSEIVLMVYDAMGVAALGMYAKITNGALSMMMVAFAVWMSFRMLEHVSSVKEVNPNEFWTEILRKLALCFVCGLIASSTGGLVFILNYVIFPVYNAFLEFGAEILNSATRDLPINSLAADTGMKNIDIVCKIVGKATIDITAEAPKFPEGLRNMMNCLICAVWQKLNFGYSLGLDTMKMPQFAAWAVGLMVIVCFTIIKISFAFYIVDTVFKMAMMCVILPLLVMSFAFKSTAKYASTGFKIILSSSVFMMFVAIVVTMTLLAMDEVIYGKNFAVVATEIEAEADGMSGAAKQVEAGSMASTSKMISNAGAPRESLKDKSKEGLRDLNVVVLCIFLICFLVVSSIGVAKEVTSKLLDTKINAGFQQKLKAVGEIALGVVTSGASAALMKIRKVKEMADKIKAIRDKANRLAGRRTKK